MIFLIYHFKSYNVHFICGRTCHLFSRQYENKLPFSAPVSFYARTAKVLFRSVYNPKGFGIGKYALRCISTFDRIGYGVFLSIKIRWLITDPSLKYRVKPHRVRTEALKLPKVSFVAIVECEMITFCNKTGEVIFYDIIAPSDNAQRHSIVVQEKRR